MKKITALFLVLSLMASVFTSCNDDNKNETDDFTTYPYSTLTPAQQKEKLATDANSFITAIEGLNEAKSVKVLNSLNALFEIAQPDFANGTSLRAATDIIYINSFYKKFTWNATSKTWTKSESVDKLILEFPSTKGGTTNDAKIEVTGVSSGENNDEYELPKELKALLYVGSSNVGTIEVKATEVSTTIAPKTADVKFVMDAYTLQINAEKGNKNVASFMLKNGSTVLLDGNADLVADLDKTINDGKLSGAGAGNTEIKIMNNLVIYGNSDLGKIQTEMAATDAKYNNDYSDAAKKAIQEEYCVSFNKNSSLVLASRDDKTKIANLGMRVKETSETYGNYTYKYYDQIPTLIFGDNSVVDADVYFGTGFNDVLSKWNSFVSKF